jgi:hypothetical protein
MRPDLDFCSSVTFFLGRIKISHFMGGVGMCFIRSIGFMYKEGLALDEHYTRDEKREHQFRDSSLIDRHTAALYLAVTDNRACLSAWLSPLETPTSFV